VDEAGKIDIQTTKWSTKYLVELKDFESNAEIFFFT
jgi:hypothetical protein